MQQSLPEPRPDWALFLDFDGTLVEIAERPDAVRLDRAIAEALPGLAERLHGALAVISGRPIAELDHQFGRRFAGAGLHGLELRPAPDAPVRRLPRVRELEQVRSALQAFAETHDGVWLEDKDVALALHYRARPELAQPAESAARSAIAGVAGLRLLHGKMVVEVKPGDADKGRAIAELMSTPVFAGRLPVFAGDDMTDEDGFAAVQARGGFGIKIGQGDTVAGYRVASVSAFGAWLAALAERLETGEARAGAP